jgi:outer membrane protein insertion porin family/translocation and assembly module TamA
VPFRSRRAALLLFLASLACLGAGQAAGKPEQKVRVAHLRFIGVKAVKVGLLKSVLATTQSSKIPWAKKNYFQRQEFDADLKRIVAFYHDRGFPDAKVASFDVKLNDKQDAVDVTLNIDEGRPILVEGIEFNGFEVVPARHLTGLQARIPLKVNAPLDRALAQATREAGLDELKDHGYPYASVRLTERAGSNDYARILTLDAEPGTLARYGPVTISGNKAVDDHVIERQLLFRPEKKYSLSQVQESQRRLYDLGTFQFVNISPDLPDGQQPDVVPLKVTVTEAKPHKVTFGVGYGSEEKLRATLEWKALNWLGGARNLELQTRYSRISSGVRLNFREPYFFSPHYDFLASAQWWHDAEPAYTLNTEGGRFTFERAIAQTGSTKVRNGTTSVSVTVTEEYERYTVSEEALNTPGFRPTLIALGLDPRTGQGQGLLSSLAFDVHRSTADSALNAQRGYLASFHIENAGTALGGDFNYFETSGEARYYRRLGRFALGAARVRLGSIHPDHNRDANVPFNKRYFLGGADSLRGWGRFEVSPLESGQEIGGLSQFESSVELRIPLIGNLTGVVFTDAGNVWLNAWSISLNDLRWDVGPGFRYLTPIGPVRVDVGYQLNPEPGLIVNGKPQTRRFRIHFSIGQAF